MAGGFRAGDEVSISTSVRPELLAGGYLQHEECSTPLSTVVTDRAWLLTVDEVGTLLRISRKAVYALIERRQLPGVRRIGRRVRVNRRELLDWLDHTCAPSPKEKRR
jgi:excisionase family DNA binding protein